MHLRIFGIVSLAALLTAGLHTHAYAQDQRLNRSALERLAESFVQKVSPTYLVKNSNEKLSQIPDGTTLLLKPRIDRLVYIGDIYAIKHEGDIFVSLLDIIDVLELAINFDEENETGNGWFLKQDWRFSIDLNENLVKSKGSDFRVQETDIYRDSGVLFIRGSSVAEWFDFSFDYDVSQQYIEIESTYPLPAVAKDARRTRDAQRKRQENRAKLPRMEQAEKPLHFDVAEVNLATRYRQSDSGEANRRNSATFGAQGQVLDHNAYGFVSMDNQQSVRSVRTRFNRQSEDPDLLGPFKARFYEFGDISGIESPLTGSNERALGFRVNNNSLVNSDFNTTDIEGNAQPDWDVELFREGVLISFQQVEEDGFYRFENVNLFAGDNDFEVVLYGPQGEIERETISIPVNEELLRTQKGTYDVSIQVEGEDTYQATPAEDEDTGQIDFAARYNTLLGGNLAYLGMRSRSIGGERVNFANAGGSTVLAGTLYNLDFAIDDNSELAAGWAARRKLLGWDVALRGQWNSDEYRNSDTENPTTLNLSTSAQRSFLLPNEMRFNARASSTYQETTEGNKSRVSELGLSNQIKNISFNNTMRHETRSGGDGDHDDQLRNSFSARGNFNKVFVRAGADYEIKPDAQVDRYFTQVNYRHDYRKNADLFLEHRPERDFSRGRLSFNYTNDYFRTSPFIELDSDDTVFAGMNLNFNLVNVPDKNLPEITSVRALGRGIVHSFVYFDKNGNLIFDGDDEPLPEVMVESVNIRKRAFTNENGHASLKAMGTSQPTDIVIDESSLPDSFMISATEGVSVFPVQGQSFNIEFPVHLAGEVDGTLFLENNGNIEPYANKKILLLPIDNPKRKIINTQAMFDGFFLFSKVPPGRYLLVPGESTVDLNIGNPLPQFIEIGLDGPVISNQNITLTQNGGFVSYDVEFFEGFEGDETDLEISYELVVDQSSESELSELVKILTFQKRAKPLLKNIQLVGASEDGRNIYSGQLDQLHETCQKLRLLSMSCHIVVSVNNLESI